MSFRIAKRKWCNLKLLYCFFVLNHLLVMTIRFLIKGRDMGNEKVYKKTALYEEHIILGAKMVPFAGWEMPLQYSGIIEEHLNVRNKAGLFDVSHMGQVFISGKDSTSFLQKLVPQDISKLSSQKALYTQITMPEGGIIDDLIIYRID